MRILYKLFLIIFVALLSTISVYAATDDFIIKATIISTTDVTPPTTPLNLTATSVATTQIDLTWSTSTDDVLLSGYQVFRDNLQIATTTFTNYSDTGLTASTTYVYYVTAFDSSNNISTSSSPATTTTLSSQVSTSITTTTYGTRINIIELVSLEVIPDTTSVTIKYVTRGYVRTVVRWGETTSYELGISAGGSFSKVHETRITGLTPKTEYKFTIEGENSRERFGIITVGTFITLSPDDIFPPSNVSNLRAHISGDNIIIYWDNPNDVDFEKVRIIRNDTFYPVDTFDGWFIYEGDGNSVVDSGVASQNGTKYYTVFSYDRLGNISSGAVVSVYVGYDGDINTIGKPSVPSVKKEDTKKNVIKEGGENKKVATTTIDFSFDDLIFSQDGKVLLNNNGTVDVDGTKKLTISIPYEIMPQHLKTIVVDVVRGKDDSDVGSYLLRADDNLEYYTTTLASFSDNGYYNLNVSVFDFETFQIGEASGDIVSAITYVTTKKNESGFLYYILSLIKSLAINIWFWIILFTLFFLFFLSRRSGKKQVY